ncbi:MAG TPA: GNAT family N-acetyltransferase [Candidatus Limnocylindrales bacterium]|nr:GNAT family N-acetyltransferase [Candidatus Limnocylindrales bacterium]
MSLQIRPAQLRDLGAIEALFREQDRDSAARTSITFRQMASRRLWFLLNHTFASMVPITSAADHVFVAEDPGRPGLHAFVQAETAPGGHAWQILNLSIAQDLDRFQAGTALLDHLCNEGLQRGVTRYLVRVGVDDPVQDLFKARGFRAIATEHALLHESLARRTAPSCPGLRPMRREDQLALYLLYRAVTPREVADVLAASFKEWRDTFQHGQGAGAVPRPTRRRQFVVDRVEIVAWFGVTAGGGGRPTVLALMARPDPPDLLASVVRQGLAYVAEHHPGPAWCSLRHNDQEAIALLQREGFEVIASQVLMVKELTLKVPARRRLPVREKRLVPQYG